MKIAIYRCAKAFRPLHPDSHLHRLQKGVCVDSGEYKASRVQRFRALGGGPDADSREGLAHRQKKAAFLRQLVQGFLHTATGQFLDLTLDYFLI